MCFARLALTLLAVLPAAAAPPTLSERAEFTRAARPTVVETFSRCVRITMVFTGPLDAAGDAACGRGAVRAGLAIASSGGQGNGALVLAAPFFAANREMAMGQDGPASDAMMRELSGTRAVGFDLFRNFGGGTQLGRTAAYDVSVFSGAGEIGSSRVRVASGRRAFSGVLSADAPIT